MPTRGSSAALRRIDENIVAAVGPERVTIIVNRPALSKEQIVDTNRPGFRFAPSGGVSAVRNLGLELGDCSLVFVDDDVRLRREAVEVLCERLEQSPGVATPRVLPASAGPTAVWDEFGFDRGLTSKEWRVDCGRRVLPTNVWDFGVGALFAIGPRCMKGFPILEFDLRLSNGLLFGGTEDVDFFYRQYLAGSTVSYCADAVVTHEFPLDQRSISRKLLGYYGSDGAFYCKWRSHMTAGSFAAETIGILRRMAGTRYPRCHKGVPFMASVGEPLAKLAGASWWLSQHC